jgi:pyruvate dehydrogenase E1 component alpha subunit
MTLSTSSDLRVEDLWQDDHSIPDGDFAGLDEEQLKRFLYEMVLMRRFEEKSGEMYTKGKIRGFLHLYIGQEACAVGSITGLKEQDKILTHYRDHGHALARGLDPGEIMAELYGRSGGVSGGRGGSMHLYDVEKGFLGGYAIVTAHLPLAVGVGLASQMKGEDAVTMCIFGDGAVGEGEFHESLNLAKLWDVPVLWFCENNQWGMGVALENSLVNDIYKLAAAYNTPAVRIDGMDVIEVYRETQKAIEWCRSGNGPYFIEAMTYRYKGHSMADPELYREKSAGARWLERDCILSLKRRMEEAGMINEDEFAAIEQRVEDEVDAAVAFAEESPPPSIDSLYDHVYIGENHG